MGQPVERNIVKDVVSRQTFGSSREHARNEFVAARVVIEHPRGEANRGILDAVEGLRPIAHFLGVRESVLVEEVELIVCILLINGEMERSRSARLERVRNVVGNRCWHVCVNADQFPRPQQCHLFSDGIPPITPLSDIFRIAEPVHQDDPGARDPNRIPAEIRRCPGEAMSRKRRNDNIERVCRSSAVRRRVGQRVDDFQLLDDRARPPVRDDQRQRILVPGADMDEMDVKPVDLGYEVRQGVARAW